MLLILSHSWLFTLPVQFFDPSRRWEPWSVHRLYCGFVLLPFFCPSLHHSLSSSPRIVGFLISFDSGCLASHFCAKVWCCALWSELSVPLVEAWPVKNHSVSFGLLSVSAPLFSINFFSCLPLTSKFQKYQCLGWDAEREDKSAVMRHVPLHDLLVPIVGVPFLLGFRSM